MTTKSDLNKVLLEMYEEGTGLTSGPVIKALNAMNNELGITDPYYIPVQNLHTKEWEGIPANGFGVVQKGRVSKRLKPVKIVQKGDKADG